MHPDIGTSMLNKIIFDVTEVNGDCGDALEYSGHVVYPMIGVCRCKHVCVLCFSAAEV